MVNYLSDLLLDIVSVFSTKQLADFDPDLIETIAHSIVSARGVVNPLVVMQSGYDSNGEELYQVLAGDREYFAAVRAMEIDPKLEMIRAFVIKPERDQAITEQVKLLRSPNTHTEINKPATIDYDRLAYQIESRITNKLYPRLEKIESELAKISSNLANNPVDRTAPVTPPLKTQVNAEEREQNLIEAINTLDETSLTRKLGQCSIAKKTIANLLERRPFADRNDLIDRTKGMGIKTFQNLVSKWHG